MPLRLLNLGSQLYTIALWVVARMPLMKLKVFDVLHYLQVSESPKSWSHFYMKIEIRDEHRNINQLMLRVLDEILKFFVSWRRTFLSLEHLLREDNQRATGLAVWEMLCNYARQLGGFVGRLYYNVASACTRKWILDVCHLQQKFELRFDWLLYKVWSFLLEWNVSFWVSLLEDIKSQKKLFL